MKYIDFGRFRAADDSFITDDEQSQSRQPGQVVAAERNIDAQRLYFKQF